MRLININTLEFEEFFEEDLPPYSILSHRWGVGEITYKDFLKGRSKDSAGYKKIFEFCEFVRRYEIESTWDNIQSVEWVWADTCCIDKKSSAELSEAINSMLEYYSRARACVVYLADLESKEGEMMQDSLRRCSWF